MNEVQTMAKAGENVGSAVGSAVGTALMTARQGAITASKNSATASRRIARRTAKQTRHKLADYGIDRAQLQELQDAFAENLWRARHELASRIEPPTKRRMPRLRLLMMIAALGAIAGAIASVISKRPEQLRQTDDRRSLDHGDLSDNGATPRQLEPSQAGSSGSSGSSSSTTRPATTRRSTGGGGSTTGGNTSPAN